MPKFEISIGDSDPIVAGLTDEDVFYISIQSNQAVGPEEIPRIMVAPKN